MCDCVLMTLTGAVAITSGFADGAGQIWLNNVRCVGTETRLIDCPANALGTASCGHVSDAGVRCSATVVSCTQGAIRLRHCHSGTRGDLQQQRLGDSM